MSKVQLYKVTLTRKNFEAPQRQRAGISVSIGLPYEGELSDEQLEAIKADPELTVEKLGKGSTVQQNVDSANKPAEAAEETVTEAPAEETAPEAETEAPATEAKADKKAASKK